MLNGPDGSTLASIFALSAIAAGDYGTASDSESLYQAAAELQKHDPSLQFTFNPDYAANTISYTVTSSPNP